MKKPAILFFTILMISAPAIAETWENNADNEDCKLNQICYVDYKQSGELEPGQEIEFEVTGKIDNDVTGSLLLTADSSNALEDEVKTISKLEEKDGDLVYTEDFTEKISADLGMDYFTDNEEITVEIKFLDGGVEKDSRTNTYDVQKLEGSVSEGVIFAEKSTKIVETPRVTENVEEGHTLELKKPDLRWKGSYLDEDSEFVEVEVTDTGPASIEINVEELDRGVYQPEKVLETGERSYFDDFESFTLYVEPDQPQEEVLESVEKESKQYWQLRSVIDREQNPNHDSDDIVLRDIPDHYVRRWEVAALTGIPFATPDSSFDVLCTDEQDGYDGCRTDSITTSISYVPNSVESSKSAYTSFQEPVTLGKIIYKTQKYAEDKGFISNPSERFSEWRNAVEEVMKSYEGDEPLNYYNFSGPAASDKTLTVLPTGEFTVEGVPPLDKVPEESIQWNHKNLESNLNSHLSCYEDFNFQPLSQDEFMENSMLDIGEKMNDKELVYHYSAHESDECGDWINSGMEDLEIPEGDDLNNPMNYCSILLDENECKKFVEKNICEDHSTGPCGDDAEIHNDGGGEIDLEVETLNEVACNVENNVNIELTSEECEFKEYYGDAQLDQSHMLLEALNEEDFESNLNSLLANVIVAAVCSDREFGYDFKNNMCVTPDNNDLIADVELLGEDSNG